MTDETQAAPAAENNVTLQSLVERYIALRDKKIAIAAQLKEKVGRIDDVLSKVEAAMLKEFKAMGVESVRTPHGTAFKSVRTSATVADWDAALDYIKSNEDWGMLEKRVSKDAVKAYREDHNDLPPGINWREDITINVRRA